MKLTNILNRNIANNGNSQSKINEEGDMLVDLHIHDVIEVKLSDKELSILDSLKLIRPELAVFYKDGLYLKNSSLESKSYILAHLLREIDSGLREVYERKINIIETKCKKCGHIERSIKDNAFKINDIALFGEFKKEYDGFDYLKGVTYKKFKKFSGHAYSILSSFHLSINEPIAKEYIMIAIWFHKYAHLNRGTDSSIRKESDIIKMWEKFEAVLYELFNYIKYDNIDKILKISNPTSSDIQKVRLIQKTDIHKNYFWGRLNYVNWLKPLYENGYFAGVNNPEPIFNESTNEYKAPIWVELAYIQNVAYQLSQNTGADFSIIINIIDDICSYRNPGGKRIVNYNTDSVIVFLISILPLQKIGQKHFNYLTTIIKSENSSLYSDDFQKRFIDKFIAANDKKNLLRCLSVILLHRKKRGLIESYRSLLDRYFLQEFIDSKNEDIIRICGIEGFKVIEKVLKKVAKDHWYNISAIEDHYQNGQNLDNFSHQVVRFVREYLLKLSCDDMLIIIISEYINKVRITIYPRIAYFIINSRYEKLSHLFWSVDFNPLKNIYNNHELFELLDKHSSTFSNDQINRVLAWIDEVDDYFEFDGKTHPSPSKKMWLTALLKTEEASVIAAYEKAKTIYPYEIKHPGFSSWLESVYGNVSPLNYNSVKEMDLSEIIKYYSNYKEKPLNQRSITDPTIEGLGDIIRQDIKNNISKYTFDIEGIATAPIGFQSSWIVGLWQYCNDNKTLIDSENVLSLIYSIISDNNFKKGYVDDETPRNRNKMFVHRVLSLLNCGLDCHGNMFTTAYLPIVKKIILTIYDNDSNVEKVEDKDITSKYINSYTGELYDALVEYNVVAAYKSEAPLEARWDNDIRQVLDAELSKRKINPLFFYALGKGYNSLFWIDKSWVDKILSIENNDNWIGFMVGFHIHHKTVTQIFEDFCNTGQYDRFFANRESFDLVMQKMVIQYMCVAYYYDKINFDLDSPLFIKVLNEKNASDYENIINFFNNNNKQIPIEKLKDLWRVMFGLNKRLDNEVSMYFIGESYRWLDFFDDIEDEIKEWMLLSVTNLQPFAASQVIRKLVGYTKKNPTQVGELLFALVSAESKIPSHSKLEEIVEELFKSGNTDVAKQISNECLRKGYLGLREVVKRYE
ncbi:MAG: hypothetical protein A2465_11070 [Bacteroidetes bacterium RIFOXYC2_FULL_39_11]|nr:MAG: hypothetical protein A2465_11070 [Bacteroidetes bacterium RIFOXYC2_FULL_39_11]